VDNNHTALFKNKEPLVMVKMANAPGF